MEAHERIELLNQVDQLRELLSALVVWVKKNAVAGEVYPLPVLPEAEVPSVIAPELAEGAEAVALCCEAITRVDRLPQQHPSTVMRVPGWLSLASDPSAKLNEINALKSTIQTTLRKAFTSTSTRTKACRELLPKVQMNQLYRHIHIVAPNTARMSFHWQPRSVASSHLSVKDAVALLQQALTEPTLMAAEGAEQAVTIALEQMSGLTAGDIQLLCRTPLAPHPRVALFAEGQGKAIKTHHANLPLLLPPREPPIRVRPLPVFNAALRGKPRGRPQLQLESVCDIVNLYRVCN